LLLQSQKHPPLISWPSIGHFRFSHQPARNSAISTAATLQEAAPLDGVRR